MKFKIEENIDLYDEITNIYESSVVRELQAAEKDLLAIFKTILKNDADNFNLVTESSVMNIDYYSIKSRVKKVKSFSEKLVRKDIGINLVKEFGKNKEEILANKSNLINKLKKLDDIIGLRIVTELRQDTFNVYKLLENNIPLFEENKIIFFDIKQQPQTMKNGLSIFRIKGEFDSLFSFELQIKSKIDEAWGEMDHTIFYKDHSSSLIKPTVQVTMNNVGIILEKLETLLYDLRHSSQIFDANSSYIEFEHNLYKTYNVAIASVFKHPIPLTEISKIVYFFKEKYKVESAITEELNYEFLTNEVNEPFYKKLLELFHSSHNLIIIEAFYHCILKTHHDTKEVLAENYEELFINFIKSYVEYLNFEIAPHGDFVSSNFYILLEANYNYISSNEVILNLKKIKEYQKINSLIINELDDYGDDRKKIINNLFFLAYFSSDYNSYYNDNKGDLEFNVQELVDLIETQSVDYGKDFSDVIKNLSQSLKKITQ